MSPNSSMNGLVQAGRTVAQWARRSRARARMRDELRRFDRVLFDDIGVVPADLWAEANKPFWRA